MTQTKDRLLHHVTITVFGKPHDDLPAVLKGLDAVSPVPTATLLEQEKNYDGERPNTVHYRLPDVELTVQQTPSDEGTLTIYTLFFKRMAWVNAFARQVVAAMTPEEHKEYGSAPETLLDSDARFSLRLDKELLMQGKVVLTDDGNCYQVKASVAAYPKNDEQILETVKRMLS
jgi:RNA binding exosome subunit